MTPKITVQHFDTIVVGSGCAGFNAADWLYDLGRKNIAIVTEGVNKGTSRNTGSDKQTYYKLSLSSSDADSVADMARTLFDGGGVDGRIAQTEAACSVKSFIKLANLGVDFPVNKWGEYVGYKTDHDPARRATSAGPLTSRYMTEALERSVQSKNIQILDNTLIVKIVHKNEKVLGLIGICTKSENELVYLRAEHVIWCTGGPAGVYADSVFPASQTGMSGVLLEAGVAGANLQDWQYGLASTKFRWNVSGSYQQVIPRYISIDDQGVEREFLFDQGEQRGFSAGDILDRVFLKGYQWPFDVKKLSGSSSIDIFVYRETVELGRKVYMDFRKNPSFLAVDSEGEKAFDILSDEARNYLKKSDLLFGTPIQRLEKMNPLAIELYKNHNIDLYTEPLEVRVCAQHHNGGILVDEYWQTNIHGLYAAGECAGTFGAFRPGGTALNSTQVGSMRAAQHIAWNSSEKCVNSADDDSLTIEEKDALRFIADCMTNLSEIKTDFSDTQASTAIAAKASTAIAAKASTAIAAKASTAIAAKASTTIAAKASTTIAAKASTTIAAKASTTIAAKASTTIAAKASTTIAAKASTTIAVLQEFQKEMSAIAAHIRNPEKMKDFQQRITDLRTNYWQKISIEHNAELPLAFKTYDMLITQGALLSAMEKSAQVYGSRGSALIQKVLALPDTDYAQTMVETKTPDKNVRIITTVCDGNFISNTQEVQSLPIDDDWFENVWAEHRKMRSLRYSLKK